MRFVELDANRCVRYVLPAGHADEYGILPPNAVEIAIDAEVSEGDVCETDSQGNVTFKRPESK